MQTVATSDPGRVPMHLCPTADRSLVAYFVGNGVSDDADERGTYVPRASLRVGSYDDKLA